MSRWILTNNPKILSSSPTARWIDGGPLEVIMECRRMVHEGYPLLAHPLTGDIHLIRNPYRTVILGEKKEEVDLISLNWIEGSIEKLRSVHQGNWVFGDSEDYQTIDFELVQTVINLKVVIEIGKSTYGKEGP